ncbi:hypothetical protein Tsubulata_003695 [Turnera subulata]|uniref:Peptidase C1A papain C-terminal domain-containing protein n=1 Tax=Turnera subulata TaxID=218843 RepID=A0A9Q0JPQ7_9ROSI|nr:hypothetical protein Tsubulata_003695 [Turnera subulata]
MSAADLNSDDDYDSVEQRDIARQFRKELQESEGFDCTVVPDEFDIGGFAVVDLEKHSNTAKEVEEFTIRAVKKINDKPGDRKLEFLRVLSANLKLSPYFTLYVTLVAKDMSSGGEVVFQTKFYETLAGELHVQIFRPKHDKSAVLIADESDSSNQQQASGASDEIPLSMRSLITNVPSHFDKSIRKLDIAFKWMAANGLPSNHVPRDAMMNPGRIYLKSYVGEANMDETKLIRLLVKHPVIGVLRATRAFFKLKKQEIFEGAAENEAYTVHSLTVVGYGSSDDGRHYFLVASNWGKEWADDGCGRVMRKVSLPPGRSSIFTHIYYPVISFR